MRRSVVRVLLAVVAIEVVLGLLPFTAHAFGNDDLDLRCKGVLVEAWPDKGMGDHGVWFNYAPNGEGEVYAPDSARAALCGQEARSRLWPPVVATTVAVVVVLGMTMVRKRTAPMPRTEEGA